MSRSVAMVLRGIVGVVVVVMLLLVVNGWWREYKEASTLRSAGEPVQNGSGTGEEGGGSTPASGDEVVVVLVDGLNLRSKPEADAKAVRSLKKGERLTLIKTEGAWYLVKTAEGDEGWTSTNPSYSKIEKK